jgi:hypothetical protein
MRKLLTIIFILAGSYSMAQKDSSSPGLTFRLNAYTTYAFDDNYVSSYYSTTSYFEGKVIGGFQYGGGLEIIPFSKEGFEVSYLRLDSKAPMEYYNAGIQFTNFDLNQNWLMIGSNRYFKINSIMEPYAGLQLGMEIIGVTNPDNLIKNTATKFAWGIKAGVNVWATDKLAIKFQTSLLSAVQAIGGGFYFGTGGSGASATGYSTYYQFNLGGGIVFKMN